MNQADGVYGTLVVWDEEGQASFVLMEVNCVLF